MMLKTDLSDYILSPETLLRFHTNDSLSLMMQNGVIVEENAERCSGVSAACRSGRNVGFAARPGMNRDAVLDVIARARANCAPSGDAYPAPAAVKAASPALPEPAGAAELRELLAELDSYLSGRCGALTGKMLDVGQLCIEKQYLSGCVDAYQANARYSFTASLSADGKDGPVSVDTLFSGCGTARTLIAKKGELFARLDRALEALEKKKYCVPAPTGETVCLLGPDPGCMLVHEAIGHTFESDLVLGGSVASRTMGQQVASPLVTIGDFAGDLFGLPVPQPILVDDEGSPARDAILIRNGIQTGYMHDRDSALYYGTASTGNARAFTYADTPIIRMRNTAIVPGTSKFEEMLSSIDHGLYLVQAGMGQADTTGEFMIAIQEGYQIEHGRLGDSIRDTVVSGRAFDVMRSVDMVGDEVVWDIGGLCGKGQPMVTAAGSPILRCRLNVGG